jgi:hypothetical protein
MVKSKNHKIRAVIGVIFMLMASPLTVTYAQTDTFDSEVMDSSNKEISKSEIREEKVKAILAERIVDGKLLVRQFDVPENASSDEIRKILMFDGKTNGWAYIHGKAYNSGIVLFDGRAIKIGEQSWKLSTKGEIKVGGRNLDLDLTGKVHGNRVILHGTASNEELKYRIVLSGNIAQVGEENVFALSFIHAGLKNPDSGPNITLYQLGQITIESPDGKPVIDSFKRTILVV